MFTDVDGKQYKKVAENETTLFLVPVTRLYDGGIEYNYEGIKAIDKREPGYPLEKVISYTSGITITGTDEIGWVEREYTGGIGV